MAVRVVAVGGWSDQLRRSPPLSLSLPLPLLPLFSSWPPNVPAPSPGVGAPSPTSPAPPIPVPAPVRRVLPWCGVSVQLSPTVDLSPPSPLLPLFSSPPPNVPPPSPGVGPSSPAPGPVPMVPPTPPRRVLPWCGVSGGDAKAAAKSAGLRRPDRRLIPPRRSASPRTGLFDADSRKMGARGGRVLF